MNSKNTLKAIAIVTTSAIFSLSTIQSAIAAPGNLATAPLFLSDIVEPNVFFTLDDSGSMDYEIVVEDPMAGFTVTNGLPEDDGGDRMGYYHPTQTELYNGRARVPPSHEGTAAWDKYWVLRNHNGNKIYYNPATDYTPWPGADANGDPMFDDATATAAPDDPVNPDNTVNLEATLNFGGEDVWLPTYYIWDDDDGDGIIEATDDYTKVEIAAGSDEMDNFANWWVYYRSRMNTTKAAIGAVINNTDGTRMGLGLFNGPAGGTGTPQQTDLASMNDPDDKRTFLEAFYGVKTPARGTPGREAMEETGDMFADSGILDDDEGGECQQNFNVYMSDGYWSSNNGFNVGNNDIDGPGPWDGGGYADAWDDTLADVAMHYYETDLRPGADYPNNVKAVPGVDEATHQHMVNFTIAFGVNGAFTPGVDIEGTFAWPEPVAGDVSTVDDMWHAAYNSRGEYLNADSPAELETALGRSLAAVAERTATAAAVSINSAKLTTNTIVYLAEFNTNGWQGDLKAFRIRTDAEGVPLPSGELEASPAWRAAQQLNARNIATDPRVIMTHDGSEGVQFEWSNLSTSQKRDLRTNPSGGLDNNTVGMARLDYLKGSQDDEGTGNFFRERLSLLADMVNSGPVFVGKPDLRWPDTAPFPDAPGQRYSEFKNGPDALRKEMVYAGSNGGFMHGFDANTGREDLAYVANNLFSENANEGLHYLTDQNYIHKYYNDLTPTVSDVYDGTGWQTVLISGQRGGGRGIFALDVTNPGKFTDSDTDAEDVVMWEFSDADDPNLGFTYSRPQIGLANDGSWVAIFSSGYNDTGVDGLPRLYILKINQGASGWVEGGSYEAISLPAGYGSPGDRNGLASPALADIDGNGTIDRAYAGDLRGNMWVFDLSDENDSNNWDLAYNQPLFTTDGGEPITAQPTLSKHPTVTNDGSNDPNVMVFFGSGQYLVNGDKTSTDDNHFHGVWDRGDSGRTTTHLQEQTFQTGFTDINGNSVRVLSRNPVDYTGGSQWGWFFELPDTGERSVTRPVVRGDVVFFNTFVPETIPCSYGGYGFRMAVDIINGGSPENPTFDVDQDTEIDDDDRATDGSGNISTVVGLRQEGFLPEPVFIEDISYTAEVPGKVAKLKNIPKGRFSWQELIQ